MVIYILVTGKEKPNFRLFISLSYKLKPEKGFLYKTTDEADLRFIQTVKGN